MRSTHPRTGTGLIALLMLANAACSDDPANNDHYVLVHGAFMGAWAWDEVAPGLRSRGATVTAIDWPAHGADMTPVSAVTLDACVAKVDAAVSAAGKPVVLVGHSAGGALITQVAEQRPNAIAKLIYLAAFVPKDGQPLGELVQGDKDSHLAANLMPNPATGTASLPLDKLQDIFCADCPSAAVAKHMAKYRDEPLAPLASSVHRTDANWGKVKKVYIYTKNDNALSPGFQKAMTMGVPFAKTVTLDTSHSPFLSQPSLVVETLLGL